MTQNRNWPERFEENFQQPTAPIIINWELAKSPIVLVMDVEEWSKHFGIIYYSTICICVVSIWRSWSVETCWRKLHMKRWSAYFLKRKQGGIEAHSYRSTLFYVKVLKVRVWNPYHASSWQCQKELENNVGCLSYKILMFGHQSSYMLRRPLPKKTRRAVMSQHSYLLMLSAICYAKSASIVKSCGFETMAASNRSWEEVPGTNLTLDCQSQIDAVWLHTWLYLVLSPWYLDVEFNCEVIRASQGDTHAA